MSGELIFNELCLEEPFAETTVARDAMNEFVLVLRDAAAAGAVRGLRVAIRLEQRLLAPGYVVAQWLSDPRVDRELRR